MQARTSWSGGQAVNVVRCGGRYLWGRVSMRTLRYLFLSILALSKFKKCPLSCQKTKSGSVRVLGPQLIDFE